MANAGSFKKGEKRPNQGKRGPGKVTAEFRDTVQKLLDDNRANVAKWLKAVAEGTPGDPEQGVKPTEGDPGKALDLLHKLAEYAAPKLARTEHAGSITVRSLAEELAELNKANGAQ
ncbi:hypothetical protein [Variovorax soli]|uniref:Terminase small subunit n=1 Tax=Variovorax soli TaxID=376815 RepID=A0ABU1NK85_9BURK|nr:hypothetical protein [Variovorax soli]MDR6538857.1 hypothetical protein [Variovorax soli]